MIEVDFAEPSAHELLVELRELARDRDAAWAQHAPQLVECAVHAARRLVDHDGAWEASDTFQYLGARTPLARQKTLEGERPGGEAARDESGEER